MGIAGHTVHTPDLFDGLTFGDLEEGVRFAHQLGFGEIIARGQRKVERLPAELVYVGYPLWVLPAKNQAEHWSWAFQAAQFEALRLSFMDDKMGCLIIRENRN